MRQWQVEWMSRPDEREHIEIFDDFRRACRQARDMSNVHDGSAVLIALDDHPEGGKHATGHMDFTFGILTERAGTLANVVPDAARRKSPC